MSARVISLIAVAAVMVGCDSNAPSGDGGDDPPSAVDSGENIAQPRPPRSPPGGNDIFGGRLVVAPRIAEPGEELTVRVRNTGSLRMYYGACTGVQVAVRRARRWVSANKDVFGRVRIACVGILYSAPPGGEGPKLGGREKSIALPLDLESGEYRLVVDVHSGPLRQPAHRLRLFGRFRVEESR
jgi:hypothetical protein